MHTFHSFLTEATGGSTPHKDLRAEGWKKSHSEGDRHVYTHPDHVGHEIHVHPKTGAFDHKVKFEKSLHQTGAVAKGRSELAKHLDTHTRQVSYAHSAVKHDKGNWDRGRSGYSDGPGPRGYQG